MGQLSQEVFVERTRDLLVRQGCPDVSLSSVLTACQANKGSLYHFFPNGKDELVIAAIEQQARLAIAMSQKFLQESSSTSAAIFHLVRSLAEKMDASDYALCLPFSAVEAISREVSEGLRLACVNTLTELEDLYAGSLRAEGMPSNAAKPLASMIATTIEGALPQSRTRETSLPLRNAALHLRDLIESRSWGSQNDV